MQNNNITLYYDHDTVESSKPEKKSAIKVVCKRIFMICVLFFMLFSSSSHTLVALSQPDVVSSHSDFIFTDISYALPWSEYVSNTTTLHELEFDTMAEVIGGNGTSIIKNGIDTKKTKIQVSPWDTFAIRTITPTEINTDTNISISIGSMVSQWNLSTVARESFSLETWESSWYTTGDFSVWSAWNANYNYPIFASPGTSWMTPWISLQYNHSTRYGALWVGWNMSWISMIRRCPATLNKDGYNDGVDFDTNDKFCLDGNQLVAVSGEYGADGTEYRTEYETFSKILSHGVAGNWPQRFTVWTKTWLRMEYAYTQDSRIEVPWKNDVYYWNVSKIEDTLWNYMDFHYEEHSWESYISRIDYTGNDAVGLVPYNSMKFFYTQRPNITEKFVLGESMQRSKILQSIHSYHRDIEVRRYIFGYIESKQSRESLLSKITECGINTCLKPLEFVWENPENLQDFAIQDNVVWIEWTKFAKRVSDEQIKIFPGDFNGDGYTDIVELKSNGNNTLTLWNYGGNFQRETSTNGLVGKSFSPDSSSSASSRILTWDFDGNGAVDVLKLQHNGSQNWMWNYSSQSSWEQESSQNITKYHLNGTLFHTDIYKSRVIVADFNGDSRSDVIHLNHTGNHWLWLSLGNGNFTYFETLTWLEWLGFDGNTWKSHIQVVDVNNDTQADILFLQSSGNHFLAVSNGDGSFEVDNTLPWLQGQNFDSQERSTQVFVWDYNADDNGDILIIQENGDHFMALWKWDNTFKAIQIVSWIETRKFARYGQNIPNFYPLDANKDGATDMMVVYPSSENVIFLSNKDGSFSARWYLWEMSKKYLGDNRNDYNFLSGDWNGNGQLWFLYLHNTGNHWVAETQNSRSDVITEIHNGNGGKIMIEYQDLTNPDVYTKSTWSQYPYVDFTLPISVVASSKSDNGIGGNNSVAYKYAGARNHQSGRWFTWFREFTLINEDTGIEVTNMHHLDHRYAGLPEKTMQRLSDGTLISETQNHIGVKNLDGGSYFAYIYRSNSKKYEIDGSFINEVQIQSFYDSFWNLTTSKTDYGSGFLDTTHNVFQNDTQKWHLWRLTQTTVTKSAPNVPNIERKAAFVYDQNTGLLIQEITQPNTPEFRVVKNYIHDAFGNIIQSSESWSNFSTKTLRSVYDSQWRFVIQVSNDLWHITRTVTEPLIWNVVSVTWPNGLVGTTYYDGMWRMIRWVASDFNESQTAYLMCDNACPEKAVHYTVSKQAWSSEVKTYYDSLDRIIRKESIWFNGEKIYLDSEYNERGEVTRQSEPYYRGETPLWNRYSYDILGRTTQVIDADGRISTMEYAPHTTTRTNAAGQVSTKITDVIGNMILSQDVQGNETTYDYDAFGKMITIRDSQGNESHVEYDAMWRRIKVVDPDIWTHTYTYNALWQVLEQQDNSWNTTTFTYDVLWRMIQKNQPEWITTWSYDSKKYGVWKLAEVVWYNGDKHEYSYDKYGRNREMLQELDGTKYYTSYTYNEDGRLDAMTYPSGLAVAYTYNDFWYLQDVRNADDDSVYRETNEVNARGQITTDSFGNGLTTHSNFNLANGYLTSLQTGDDTNQTSIQNLSFTYDVLWNITNRQDHIRSLSEDFSYDILSRLTQSHVTGQDAISLSYDELGNITSRSDVGTYIYGQWSAWIHAVSEIQWAQQNLYIYDDRGNRISSNNEEIAYTSFNKPKQIQKKGEDLTLDFSYAADAKRYKQVVTNITQSGSVLVNTKYYVWGVYEREISGSTTKDTHYITAGGENIAMVTRTNEWAIKTQYFHYDHLGSLQALSDDSGALKEAYSYDAWWKRRDADTWWVLVWEPTLETDRWFTMHEHLEEVWLIHMNGRVYDSSIGRFLSADPFVQAPSYSQSLNRYSYVMNNPLWLVDPSGYFFKKIFKSIKKIVKKVFKPIVNFVKKNWKTIVIAAIAIAAPFAVGAIAWVPVTSFKLGLSVVSWFASWFAASFTGTLLNGGSLWDALKSWLKTGAISWLTAGAFFQVGSAFGVWWSLARFWRPWKIIAHGVVWWASNIARGGKFLHGFISSSFTQAAAPSIESNFSTAGGRVLAAAVVWGTSAEIWGGKFSNGAVTGAFSRLFNEELHKSFYDKSQIRWTDVKGSGYYGAPRKGRTHDGVDYKANPWDLVPSPITWIVRRYSHPYADDLSYKWVIISNDSEEATLWYLNPSVQKWDFVNAGDIIGVAQDLTIRYKGITNHIHYRLHVDGKGVDPSKY